MKGSQQPDVSALIRDVVHQANNALAPILGFTELLLEEASLLDDHETVRSYLAHMRDGAAAAMDELARLRRYAVENDPNGSEE
jgi:hypothetical protein